MQKTASIAPAAPNEWPIIALVELTGTGGRKKIADRFRFRGIVKQSGRSVSVNIIDRSRFDLGRVEALSPWPGADLLRMDSAGSNDGCPWRCRIR